MTIYNFKSKAIKILEKPLSKSNSGGAIMCKKQQIYMIENKKAVKTAKNLKTTVQFKWD